MTDYPLERAELADYVAVDGLIIDEIRALRRPDQVNDLAESTEPDTQHFGDIIGGLSQQQADEVMIFIQGAAEQFVQDEPLSPEEQRDLAFQALLRGFMVAARASALSLTRDGFDRLKERLDDGEFYAEEEGQ